MMRKKTRLIKSVMMIAACIMLTACDKSVAVESWQSSVFESEQTITESETVKTLPSEKEDMEAHYRKYFENYNFVNMSIKTEIDYNREDGSQYAIYVSIIKDGQKTMVRHEIMDQKAIGKTSEDSVTAYMMEDGYTYLVNEIAGQKTYCKAKLSDEEKDQMFFMSDSHTRIILGLIGATQINYDHEEIIDGVLYDVLAYEKESDLSFLFYVNRDAQELERFDITVSGRREVNLVIESQPVILPEEAANIGEETTEQLQQAFKEGMQGCMKEYLKE